MIKHPGVSIFFLNELFLVSLRGPAREIAGRLLLKFSCNCVIPGGLLVTDHILCCGLDNTFSVSSSLLLTGIIFLPYAIFLIQNMFISAITLYFIKTHRTLDLRSALNSKGIGGIPMIPSAITIKFEARVVTATIWPNPQSCSEIPVTCKSSFDA